jgi:hypothetical protein
MTAGSDLSPRDAREHVASLMAELPGAAGLAAVEHQFGVLPLVAAFFAPGGALAEVAAGRRRGVLGLFTPTPEPGWGTATVEGKPAGEEILLSGEVRLASADADGSLVLFQQEDGKEQRLAWLDHGTPGIERRAGGGSGWLDLDGVAVAAGLVSRPVTLAAGGDLFRRLETYASLWALAASICARDGVRALRRAARTSQRGGKAFNSSQLVAMAITEVEIEAELTATAVERDLALGFSGEDDPNRAGGLALATAAARVLALLAERTAELRALTGHAPDGPFADPATAASLTAYLGGAPALEGELAGALGIHR